MQRTEQLLWITVLLDDVESDLSRFHRVDDWQQLTGSRFIKLAERLAVYGGAVADAFQRVQETNAAASQERLAASSGQVVDDPKMLEALTSKGHQAGFPGIEYSGS